MIYDTMQFRILAVYLLPFLDFIDTGKSDCFARTLADGAWCGGICRLACGGLNELIDAGLVF